MSLFEMLSLILVGFMFPFAGYFFKKNERLHEQTQTSQGLQDTRIAVLELRVELIERQIAGNNNGTSTTNITL